MTQNEQILAELQRLYPDAAPELHFTNPYETLIATMLSAQCTDKRVNMVTETLFQQFTCCADMAALTTEELEPHIKQCGLYHNKAKNIVAACRVICEQYGGEVPGDWDALVKLPGVGRKTANVVWANAFGGDAIAVDTHVQPSGACGREGRGKDRAAASAGNTQVRLVQGAPLADLPRAQGLLCARSQVRCLHAGRAVQVSSEWRKIT